jgi:SAM-dependent methyltransferase
MSGDDALRRASLVLRLRSMGITDHRIVSAFEGTRRAKRSPRKHYAADAYADRLIPIACGQTMEAPSVLARLLQAAPVASHMSVLEIGAGSGYFSALLAKLSRRVVALERFRSLAEGARAALTGQSVSNVDLVLADGPCRLAGGWTLSGHIRYWFDRSDARCMDRSARTWRQTCCADWPTQRSTDMGVRLKRMTKVPSTKK